MKKTKYEIDSCGLFLHPILAKMQRDVVQKKFMGMLVDLRGQSWKEKKEEASILLEHLLIVLSMHPKHTYTTAPIEIVEITLENRSLVTDYWKENLPRFTRKFSSVARLTAEFENELTACLEKMLTETEKVRKFFGELRVEMSVAEYRMQEYDEPRTPAPLGLLSFIKKRRSFFESTVPLDTKWKI